MGFFDNRCMISGLSLKSSETVLILLEKNGEDYSVISLPVTGQYNRVGAIDGIEENENTQSIEAFFAKKFNDEELELDKDEIPSREDITIEQLINGIERGVTMEYDSVVYKGKRIEFALIDKTIWDKIIAVGFSCKLNIEEHTVWKEIYPVKFSGYDELLNQLNNIQAFLELQNIKWYPPRDQSQHYEEEVTEYLEEARTKFSSEFFMLEAISEYESKLSEEEID
jgi:hypothetical protein